jgi:hypothetical protein
LNYRRSRNDKVTRVITDEPQSSSVNRDFQLKTACRRQGHMKLSPMGKYLIKRTDLYQCHSCNHNKHHEWFDITIGINPKNGQVLPSILRFHHILQKKYTGTLTFGKNWRSGYLPLCEKFYNFHPRFFALYSDREKTPFLKLTEEIPDLQHKVM